MANVKDQQRTQGQANTQADRDRSMNETGKRNRNSEGSDGLDWNIRERMAVVASCGTKVGVVDHLEGNAIKLTKNDSKDGEHHFIPVGWVDNVDDEVHLRKNSVETEQGWKSSSEEC